MIYLLLFWLAFIYFSFKRLLSYLHIFQQEEYDSVRFIAWLFRTRSLDTHATLGTLIAAILPWPYSFPLAAAVLGGQAYMEADPRAEGKKKLVLTTRASRILYLGWSLLLVVGGLMLVTLPSHMLWVWVFLIHAIPLFLCVADVFLKPVEKTIKQRYWNEAHQRFLKINPTTIGVTGSYGKTSVKHLLGHVLQTAGRTYFTKGSINTPMGVSRSLREEMPENCQYYVGEMGAYGIGSISRMCALTPPDYGMITALGEAHYERFKSLENVAKAKFELAEWTLRKNTGKPSMVVSEQVLERQYAADFIANHPGDFLLVGPSAAAHVRILSVEQTKEGTVVTVSYQKKKTVLTAPVWGEHHGHNMALVFGMCMVLGLAPEQVATVLKSAPQIKHRLEVKPQPDGTTYIDDAYNSNPTGFAGALQTLSLLKPKSGRRILVTPGMVELGEKHDAEHARLGKLAAKHADIALVVNPARIPTFVQALQSLQPNVHLLPSFTEARDWLRIHAKKGDVILLENDLPDVLEKKLKL